jgi:hypothetical protein
MFLRVRVFRPAGRHLWFVKCYERRSLAGDVTRGVPQGSVLISPLLFISYIDSVSGAIRYCQFHIYADDLSIYPRPKHNK